MEQTHLVEFLLVLVQTATSTRTNSTDGSHNVTMTISGSDGSSQPFALADVNNGTGSLDTTQYTGVLSVKAFS